MNPAQTIAEHSPELIQFFGWIITGLLTILILMISAFARWMVNRLDELRVDIKKDIGEMSKVKQRLVAIETKLGIPVHVNGDTDSTS